VKLYSETYGPFLNAIVLYASNLMRKVVPEKHAQIPNGDLEIRRLTPEMVAFDAFGRCSKNSRTEQFHLFGGTIPYL
jgi:hypothetical protein